MRAADHLIDLGPGAGVSGGRLVAQGTPAEVMKNAQSITGQFLSGAASIGVTRAAPGESAAGDRARGRNDQ